MLVYQRSERMHRFTLSDRDCAEHSSWLDWKCPSTSSHSGHSCCPNLRAAVTIWHRPALAPHLCFHICARHCPTVHVAFLSRITEIHSDKSWRHKTDRTQSEMVSSKRCKFASFWDNKELDQGSKSFDKIYLFRTSSTKSMSLTWRQNRQTASQRFRSLTC